MFLGYSESSLLKDLIKISSATGREAGIMKFLKHLFDKAGWVNFDITVEEKSAGLLVVFGTPKVLFTTHVDVVDGPAHLFTPREENGVIYGRGACDAKGSIVSMIMACSELLQSGETNFGLFLFTGEERGGKSVVSCMNYLQGFGIEYVIMGEPTMGRMAKSHLGALCLNVKFVGSACHSAYAGGKIDANRFLVVAAQKLYSLDETLLSFNGIWSVNLGRLYGGLSPNTLSPFAAMEVYIRTSQNNHEDIISLVQSIAPGAVIEVMFSGLRRDLEVIDGFKTTEAKMCSSLPHFDVLNAKLMMLGPGDPKLAHTSEESIKVDDMIEAVGLYQSMYHEINLGEVNFKSIPAINNNQLWYS